MFIVHPIVGHGEQQGHPHPLMYLATSDEAGFFVDGKNAGDLTPLDGKNAGDLAEFFMVSSNVARTS